MSSVDFTPAPNFIKAIITEDLQTNKYGGRVHTRFPPEPNGYLHIGHAKSICLNFGLAPEFKGLCNLRFDDTNPSKEDIEYVGSIKTDVRWLGFDWEDREYYASDYFQQLYEFALRLIRKGKAYVDDLSAEQIREFRGTLTEPGRESPFRNRSAEENLALFERMRSGEFPDGSRVLRAKIDMASPNLNMRDPVMYRILHAEHHRTGSTWCIYPMYDFAHGQCDSIEGITHSICTLEFEDHRPLYDWFLDELGIGHPRQIEFARLNLSHTVMSKRKLLQLVQQGVVSGWDDPRMPTLSGLRRRGYTPEAIRGFCERIGVAKRDSTVDVALLEYCIREDLNKRAPRVMAVLRPLRLIIDNYPEGRVEELDALNNPEEPSAGTRKVPFSRELYIEEDDFMETPPKKFYRLSPGREVRLRYAYFVKCVGVVKDQSGKVTEVHCTYDPQTRGGDAPDGRKVRATLHWVSAPHSIVAEVRLYDHLLSKADPTDEGEGQDFKAFLNPLSLEVLKGCRLEPGLKEAGPGSRFQFERLGYFCVDSRDSTSEHRVFNRTVTLKDEWTKIQKTQAKEPVQAEPSRTVPALSIAEKREDLMPIAQEITIDDFSKLDLRVAIVREASLVAEADKLVKLMLDIGEGRLRQVFAGIRSAYPQPEKLVGKRMMFVANLKPRQMKFGLSEGMILAGSGKNRLAVATFDGDLEPGDKVS
ncbi:MAG: glutamine--tRNA ligase/YqeY domain fusion protein [Deltaproteobacteria bacterium]|nr:glutamine--tRNA ligase/YqeY domain fusion protein [Deltaproteobacteria bacterium]NTV56122.1 glutamine--tRNA ligase/YqeY domain fusion protein [Deltaproteobacteria bacterium]